jgi:hypothetical protein
MWAEWALDIDIAVAVEGWFSCIFHSSLPLIGFQSPSKPSPIKNLRK